MSALLDQLPVYRRMTRADLEWVVAIEKKNYPHPWTYGNFSDSLDANYHCWIIECEGQTVGYGIVMIAVGEAHLLNLSIAPEWQRKGLGSELLKFLVKLARDYLAHVIYLEVRPSNNAGRRLYTGAGFTQIATRRGYYPTHHGREDAVIMELTLR